MNYLQTNFAGNYVVLMDFQSLNLVSELTIFVSDI